MPPFPKCQYFSILSVKCNVSGFLDLCAKLRGDFLALRFVQFLNVGIHREGSAPLELIFIFGHKVHVEMMTCVAIHSVIDLVGMEHLVDRVSGLNR